MDFMKHPLCLKFLPNLNGEAQSEMETEYVMYADRILVLDIIPEVV